MPAMSLTVLHEFPALAAGQAHELHVLARLEFPTAQQTTTRPPIHLALVLDRSGSMEGRKLELTKQAAVFFMNWLTRRDFLTVVTYEDNVEVLVPHTPLTDKRSVADSIRSVVTGGGTNLSGGWQRGLAELHEHKEPGHVHRVVLLTDGLANAGVTSPADLSAIGAKHRERGVVTTTVGFGDDFDEKVLKAIADSGGGRFHYVKEPESLASAFQREFGELAAMVAQNVECRLELADGATLADVLVDLPGSRSDKSLHLRLGDARAGDVKLVLLKLRVAQALCAQAGPAVLGTLSARCDPLSGDMLPENQQTALEIEVAEGGGTAAPAREVRREVWLAEGARLKLALRERLNNGEAFASAQALRRHAEAAAELAKDPTEKLVRDEIARLRAFAAQIESPEDRSAVGKALTHAVAQFSTRRGAYGQLAGVKRVHAELSPARPEEVLDVVSTVEKEVRARGFDGERAEKVKTILRELLDNAIEHGCAGRSAGKVSAECYISENYARLIVSDDGPGFDCAAKLKLEEEHTLAPGQRGRGLLLVKRMADRADWQTAGGTRAEAVVERHALQVAAEHAPRGERAAGGRAGSASARFGWLARDDFGIEREMAPEKGIVIVKTQGYLDSHTFERLEQAIADLFSQGHYRLIVDLSQVDYISSAGAGVFIGTLSEAHEHSGNIVLLNPTANVREVFDLLGLTQIFRICDDLPSAYAAF